MSNFDYPSSGERLNSAQRDELLQQVKQQVALASAQELIQKMSDKCFKKCVYKPGTSLDVSEQAFETQNLPVSCSVRSTDNLFPV